MTSAGIAVGIHALAALALLLSVGHSKSTPLPVVATFDVKDPGPPNPAPTKQPQPHKVPPTPPQPIVMPPPVQLPVVSPMVVALLEQADTQAAGACDLTYPVQVALQTSPAVQEQLPTIPDSRRSVANALAMWNQTWVEPDLQLKPQALDIIRTTVATTIEAASAACRAQLQGGPRLIFLTSDTATTVLALGSGEWTWQQVADSAQPDFDIANSLVVKEPDKPFGFAKVADSLF
ncbi:MAG: hypothetical protein ABIT09_03010 [Croceibacterium sp.]